MDEAVLNRRGLSVQAHDLVTVGLVARDARKAGCEELLDQLRPRCFVLDQNGAWIEEIALFPHCAFEAGKVEFLAQDVEEVEVGALHTPRGADGIIGVDFRRDLTRDFH